MPFLFQSQVFRCVSPENKIVVPPQFQIKTVSAPLQGDALLETTLWPLKTIRTVRVSQQKVASGWGRYVYLYRTTCSSRAGSTRRHSC